MKNKKAIITILTIILIIMIVIGTTYAYFSANIEGEESSQTITAIGGTLSITVNGGNNINVGNIVPSYDEIATKTITLSGTNTTELIMPYIMSLVINANTFTNNAISYTLESTNTSSNGSVIPSIPENQGIATGSSTIELGSGKYLKGSELVHTYKLKIYFLETGEDQNIDQGKIFNGYIEIKSSEARELSFADYIIDLASDSVNTGVYDENGYRYEGANPNNYVTFNNELWRVIGVFDSNTHGITGQNLVKIVRSDILLNTQIWDKTGVMNWGNNDWNVSNLKALLNENYYYGTNEAIATNCTPGICDFTITGITDQTSRDMIENVTWKLGSYVYESSDFEYTSFKFFTSERGTIVYSGQPTSGEGYIGLLYPSDYGFSVLASSCARTTSLYNYNTGGCSGQSWLFKAAYEWTLMPDRDTSYRVYYMVNNKRISYTNANYGYGVRPTIYLKYNVKKIEGTGSIDQPYILIQN